MIQTLKESKDSSKIRIPRANTDKVTSHQMCKIAKRVLGRDGDELVKLINIWASTRGKSECISMMKNRWNYIQHLAAEDLTILQYKELANTYRIRLKPNSIYPKGVYGNLAHNYVNGGPKTREKFSSILKSYTMITPKLNNKSVIKLLETIQSDHETTSTEEYWINQVIQDFCKTGWSHTLKYKLSSFIDKGWYSQLDLTCFKMSKSRYTPFDVNITRSNTNLIKGFLFSYPSDPDFYEVLADGEVLDKNSINLSNLFYLSLSIEEKIANGGYGKVDYDTINCGLKIIPKSGANGRVIASLNSWDQLLMYPLHKVLDNWTMNIKPFRHYNQLSGASDVAEWDDSVAIDLTAATDTIPVSLFVKWAESNELYQIGTTIDSISSRLYKVELPEGGTREVQYSRGQPMGMFGSFPILQICNFMVAWSAYKFVFDTVDKITSMQQIQDNFLESVVIVGDDIAFKDKQVADYYSFIMKQIGVPINKYKCFSNKKSQFAGFEIDKLGGRFEGKKVYYRPFKFQTGRFLSDTRSRLGMFYTFPEAWEIKYSKGKVKKTLPTLMNPITHTELSRKSLLPDLTYIESTHDDHVPSKTRSNKKLLNRILAQINGYLMELDLEGVDLSLNPWDSDDQPISQQSYSFDVNEYIEEYGDSEITEDLPDPTPKSKKRFSL